MPIIYEPAPKWFSLRDSLTAGLKQAVTLGAIDFVAQSLKPWAYYAGVLGGNAAVATGIPGAAATIYVVGDLLDYYVFKSEDSSDLRVFLNGVQISSIETYAVSQIWEAAQQINLQSGYVNRVDFVNYGVGATNAGSIPWMALADITVSGGEEILLRSNTLMPNTLAVRISDSETDTRLATVPVYLPTGLTLAEIQAYSDLVVAEIDDITGGKVEAVEVTLSLDLPGAIKGAAEAGVLNERGGLIPFTTSGPRGDSVRIPAIKTTIMPGDSFAATQADVAALITRLTTSTDISGTGVQPQTANGFNWLVASDGKKSFRRK